MGQGGRFGSAPIRLLCSRQLPFWARIKSKRWDRNIALSHRGSNLNSDLDAFLPSPSLLAMVLM